MCIDEQQGWYACTLYSAQHSAECDKGAICLSHILLKSACASGIDILLCSVLINFIFASSQPSDSRTLR